MECCKAGNEAPARRSAAAAALVDSSMRGGARIATLMPHDRFRSGPASHPDSNAATELRPGAVRPIWRDGRADKMKGAR